ncbi:alpha/beta fold hydrolase [Kribbella sp. CA-293567]|uniref:alpha/beta fold hydrolase n=1 Tax=Kribbella sp. CA-293567 TaxID=3002436 RepID=UPI0022DDD7F2|nr:alpha/beta hydrolase [Kribbella sp. CA-293567]WBQ05985.1 alpha/beta hydrolase [Kribbella sp. CA-293567]
MDDLLRLPDGRRAQYWSGGDPDGSVVFFLHGCPDTRHAAYAGEAAARRTGVRLVAVNRPGYGLSDEAASDHLSVAGDVAAVADLLGVARYGVLGMSLGGPYALACAVRDPSRVTAVQVVASPGEVPALVPPYHRDGLSVEQQEFYELLARTPVEEAIELMRPEFETYVGKLALDSDDEEVARRFVAGLDALDAEVAARQPVAELAASIREALTTSSGYLRDAAIAFRPWLFRPEKINCPTTLWYGEHDTNASIRNGEWLAGRIPGAELLRRPGDGHLGSLHNHWDEILRGF